MQCCSKLFKVLIRFISEAFPKQLFSSALRKKQFAAPFVERLRLVLNIIKNAGLGILFELLMKFIDEIFPKQLVKVLYESINEQLLSQSSKLIVFYQKNVNENLILSLVSVVLPTANLLVILLLSSCEKRYNRSNGYFLLRSILYKTLQSCIQNSVIHPKWSFCDNSDFKYFCKKLHFRCLTRA